MSGQQARRPTPRSLLRNSEYQEPGNEASNRELLITEVQKGTVIKVLNGPPEWEQIEQGFQCPERSHVTLEFHT